MRQTVRAAGPNDAGLKGVAIGLFVVAITLCTGLAASAVWDIKDRREHLQSVARGSCANPKDCGPEGLHASLRSAAAAEDLVDLAVWQLLLSAAGLAGVGLTVRYAHLAWQESAKSSSAALQTFEADNRTWMTVRPFEIESLSHDGKEIRISVALDATNVGAKPAFDVHLHMNLVVGTGGAGPEILEKEITSARLFAELPGNSGIILLSNEQHRVTFSTPASRTLEVDERLRAIGVQIRPGERMLSLLYCAHYKSPGFTHWHVSAGIVHIMRRDGADFAKDFSVQDIIVLPSHNHSCMT